MGGNCVFGYQVKDTVEGETEGEEEKYHILRILPMKYPKSVLFILIKNVN